MSEIVIRKHRSGYLQRSTKKGDGGLSDIGRVKEVRYKYDDYGNGVINAETRTYKYRQLLNWRFEIAESTYNGGAVLSI